MGESGIVSVAPAVGNALFNATGVRLRTLPLTPERVWRALRDQKRGR
jgi:CO/xanthine dehydrogenase Mo-binding subunit